ncbi:MAG TPA: exodeoxyribonuclease VII small subunit [Candidatus Paceibacterota bacterium]
MAEKPVNLKESLKKLNTIVEWFEAQEEIDVEAGLEKVKEGAALVKVCKKRLSEIENEFEQIQRAVGSDDSKESPKKPSRAQSAGEDVNPDDVPF